MIHDATHTAYARALDARDARFDGLFFVGITSTRIYCRPVCPARVSYTNRRRFFETAAAAEHAGFRPCLRCRPELAPGRASDASVDAVPRLAQRAAKRIASGALNGRAVGDLARDLGVSARHLRRAMERTFGVSPLELAQTHRLLLAKRLLADTALSVTRVAYASGFGSLRRFNAAFQERYRMPPTAVRRTPSTRADAEGWLTLTLSYRPPLAWRALVATLARDALPGVTHVDGDRYARTVRIGDATGAVSVALAPAPATHVIVDVTPSLVPALMPLLARLRHLLDLDAEPQAVDAHLAREGLAAEVARAPGLRAPGAVDGFEIALQVLAGPAVARVVESLGDPVETGRPELTRVTPTARRVADAGADGLVALGVAPSRARTLHAVASAVATGTLALDPGHDPDATQAALRALGASISHATTIVGRALAWPDAFHTADRALNARAEAWRPWRAYAALHLADRPTCLS